MYLIRLSRGLAEMRTGIIELHSDADAIRVAQLTIEREAAQLEGPSELTVLVGRGAEPDTCWLGAWHWNGGPEWHE